MGGGEGRSVKVARVCKINLRSTASAFTRLKSGVPCSFEPELRLYKLVWIVIRCTERKGVESP